MSSIDNGIYDTLGDRWYTADDDPVALLRAESKVKCAWVSERLRAFDVSSSSTLLDVGCGAGFISNHFAGCGMRVTGIDLSEGSLAVARKHDATKSVAYIAGDAYHLPFEDAQFDVVTAMDFLEHVEDPGRAIAEMSRVLKPGGLLFYHTFDRNPVSYVLVIKALEWLIKNTPRHMHLYSMFIKPLELAQYCRAARLEPLQIAGIKPVIFRWAFWKTWLTGRVHPDFAFETCASTMLSYIGVARSLRGG